jgi:hypothetical protein
MCSVQKERVVGADQPGSVMLCTVLLCCVQKERVVGSDQPGELQRTRRGERAETFRAPAAGTPPHHAAQGGVHTGDQAPTSGTARQVTHNNQCCGTGTRTGTRTGIKTGIKTGIGTGTVI